MMHYFDNIYHWVLRYADRLGPSQWVILLAFIVVLGAVCLRGYGSRSNY